MDGSSLKDVRVEYSVAATINLGKFENIRPSYALTATIPDGTNPTEAREKIKALVDSWLEADILAHRDELSG